MKKRHLVWIIPIAIILILFLIRLTSPREIDDVHPNIPCEMKYLEKADILWIVPNFKNIPVNQSEEWCQEILALNKTLGIHGYKHTYEEFSRVNITQEEITKSINYFEKCFGFKPTMFKPPQLRLNDYNRELLKKNNFKIMQWFNQGIHKAYHCDNDTTTNEFGGYFSNTFHDWL